MTTDFGEVYTDYHAELDEMLENVLWQINVNAQEAVWRLEEMYWDPPKDFGITPAYQSYEAQRALRERWEAVKGINYAIPGARRHGKSHALGLAMDGSPWEELFPGIAGQRILGNEPWHFEYVAPKLPWWKRLYRTWKRYRFARLYGASKRKALGIGVKK